jgi:N12 class adenine-specific DNA methylase
MRRISLYDNFTSKYGLISSRENARAFSDDSSYYLLSSLEIIDEEGKLERKADIFSKRTIQPHKAVEHVETSVEALAVSISEKARVDLDYMASLTGFDQEKIVSDLRGIIFQAPDSSKNSPVFQTADEYLSGNVREKLATARAAASQNVSFQINAEALEKVQPQDLEASEIAVRLGSSWINPEYYRQFILETLRPPVYARNGITVLYSAYTGEWTITGASAVSYSDVPSREIFGTQRMNAYEIIKNTLNLRSARVYDTVEGPDGKDRRVLNKKQTMLAQQKQELLKQTFQEWVWKDPTRRHDLVKLYNERFNSTRPREYDGSHIIFSGMNPEITLRPHQLGAIAHQLYGGNTLLAHEVGSGKSFEMIAAAMEARRLGLCRKSLFAMPNHLTEQFGAEFLRLYPAANILVATKKDFEPKNRKKFCARIATGNYDAVIIGHSQMEKIPISVERQERFLREQLHEIIGGIHELKSSKAERFTVKQMERAKKSIEEKLAKLHDSSRKDDVINFEELGIDRLFVDEAHAFKNLAVFSKMTNVAGIAQTDAKKSSDLFAKCRFLDEITGNRGIVFATGTPVNNTMVEVFTMQRYLQYDTLQKNGFSHFDCWASTFGEAVSSIELAPEGSGYRAKTRFAKFFNLPELMNMFKEVADVKTADGLNLPRPLSHFQTIAVPPSDIQQEMVNGLSARASDVHNRRVDPHFDNMLKITSDGRKIELDQRLVSPLLPDDPGSKVNACMENVFKIWGKTRGKKSTQLIFSDFSTPGKDGKFNVYDDLRSKLIQRGVPESEIAFIHTADTELKKKELFAKVRKGKVRILLGSTQKMGAGTNVQNKLIAIHDLDAPWRPADLEQRSGRIIRQGNENPEVYIYRYVTERTFDAYLYQTLENKQKFISQIMTSKSPVRSCQDVDESALSFAEIKALCAGDSKIREKMELDIDVARLKVLKSEHQSQKFRLEDNLIRHYPKQIESMKNRITALNSDIVLLQGETKLNEKGFSPMLIGDKLYADKEKAGEAILELCKEVKSAAGAKIGAYRGFEMSLRFDPFGRRFELEFKGSATYSAVIGTDVLGNIRRINNALEGIPQELETAKASLENLHSQVENAKNEITKPFSQEDELAEKSARLALLDTQLNLDGSPEELTEGDSADESGKTEAETVEEAPKSEKGSILMALKAALPPPKANIGRDSLAAEL